MPPPPSPPSPLAPPPPPPPQGFRCVEIDCFDGPGGEPEVYHQHSVTSRVAFRKVCEAIEECAFPDERRGPRGRESECRST